MSGSGHRARVGTGRAGASTRRRVGAAALLVVVVVLLPATPAGWAAASVHAGWWTSAPVALSPDASADQLVVQGSADPNAPVSYAAVAYELEDGEVPSSVRLEVAPGSASTPNAVLTACPLTAEGFEAARGGPSADAPDYDCATSVQAEPQAGDIVAYQFDVSSLTASGTLAFAVLPTNVSDRVVLAVPTTSSLESTFGASPAPEASDLGADPYGSVPVGSGDVIASDDYSFPDMGVPDLPSVVQLGKNPEVAAAPGRGAVRIANSVAAEDPTTDSSRGLAALCAGLVALGIVSWTFAARRPVAPT